MNVKGYWLHCRKCGEAVPYQRFGYDFKWHKSCTIFDRPGRRMSKQLDFASHGRAYSNIKAVELIPAYRAEARVRSGKLKFGGTDLELLALESDRK